MLSSVDSSSSRLNCTAWEVRSSKSMTASARRPRRYSAVVRTVRADAEPMDPASRRSPNCTVAGVASAPGSISGTPRWVDRAVRVTSPPRKRPSVDCRSPRVIRPLPFSNVSLPLTRRSLSGNTSDIRTTIDALRTSVQAAASLKAISGSTPERVEKDGSNWKKNQAVTPVNRPNNAPVRLARGQ